MWYERKMYPEYNGRQCVFYTLNACLVNNKIKRRVREREIRSFVSSLALPLNGCVGHYIKP